MKRSFTIQNSKGMKVVGLLRYSEAVKRPCVIVSHGFLATRRNGLIKEISDELYKAGFAVITFDYTGGIGDSEGSMSTVTVAQQLDDLDSVMDFAQRNIHIDNQRIGLAGHSMGGSLSMQVAYDDDRVKALVMLASPANFYFQNILEEKTFKYLAETLPEALHNRHVKAREVLHFYGDARLYDLLRIADKIKIPTLFLHGEKDVLVKPDSSKSLFEKVRGKRELVMIKNGTHGLLLKSTSKKAAHLTVKWMKENL